MITEIIRNFLTKGHTCESFSLNEEFCIIENPSFNIIPNHAYRSPFVVAAYCHKGFGHGRVDSQSFYLEPGGFFIVLPGQITELVDITQDFECTYIVMTTGFTESLSIGNTFNLRKIVSRFPYKILGTRATDALNAYITMCKNLINTESNPHRCEILQLLTRAFFLGFGYFLHDNNNRRTQSRAETLTEDFISLVEENYHCHRNLAFYASKLGITTKHLSRIVKGTSGKSAIEWIEKFVVMDAQYRLTSTKDSIKQIAYNLNFPSQSFFGKYFSRIVGYSPAEFRRRHQK